MSPLGKLPFPFSHSSSSSADAPGPSATPERRPSRLHQRLSSIGSIGKKSLRRRKKSLSSSEASSSYHPYAVYYQNMLPLLRDPAVLKTVLESILEMPGGKRMLSRMARTCRALSDPVLNMLWKELDSLIPLLGLFPGSVLKKARKPGLGMQRAPQPDEWKKVLKYGERVRRLTYIESAGNVNPNVFPIIEQHRPRTYILPNLLTLVWRVETPAGLDRAALFLNPDLLHMTLEVGTRVPQLDAFLADLSRRTKLLSFSFTSATPLPDKFTELLAPQDALERVMLSAPGALSADVGRWASTLQHLQSLRLDLSERTQVAVQGFFDEVPRSGVSTPASAHTDSGVFSDDERDTKDPRKDSARLTAHARPRGAFARLRHLHLTGQAGAIAVFLKHITSPLVQLELVIDDPPEKNAWRELSGVISERYASSLATLRVSATGASRFTDLLRNTTRDPPSKHLPLQHLGPLSRLARLEIDLPESVIFTRADVEHVAQMCPRLENVKLCPFARFPIGTRAPLLGLNDLAPLTSQCRRLQSLAVVIDARKGWSEILEDRNATSTSLRQLHFGHSWIGDPLPVSVALSHLAPRLEGMRWFHDRTRPGLHEPHARAWQQVADGLPMLQHVRLTERKWADDDVRTLHSMYQDELVEAYDEDYEKIVHVAAREMAESGVQVEPERRSRGVYVRPSQASTAVDATPVTVSTGVNAVVHSRAQEVDATPRTSVASIEAIVAKSSQSVATEPEQPPVVSQPPPPPPLPPTSWPNALLRRSASMLPNLPGPRQIIALPLRLMNPFFVIPAMLNLMSFACRLFILYPLTIPIRVLHAVLRLFLVRGRRVLGKDPRAPGNGPRPTNGRPDGLLSGDSRSPSAPRLGSRLPSPDGRPLASVELQDMKTLAVPVNVNGADCVEPGLGRTTPYEETYEMDTIHDVTEYDYDFHLHPRTREIPSPRDAVEKTLRKPRKSVHFAFGVGNMSVEEEDVLIAGRVSGPRSPRKEVMVATWATRHLGTSCLSSPSIAPGAPTTNTTRVLSTSSTKYAMSDNKKQERDYTPEVDALLPEAEALVKSGKLQEGIDKLFVLEKQSRNASDAKSTTRLVKAIVQHAYDARNFEVLNNSIQTLSKKHGQLKSVIQAMVEQVIAWLPEVKERDGTDKWLELLETLRTVTEGKIFLETPRARVTLLLSHYYEAQANETASVEKRKELLIKASEILSELQVETYSSMERREKTEFILEQMRLLISVARIKDAESAKKEEKDALGGGEGEWVKVRVGGRKVNEEFLKEKENEDLKLKYYDLMIQHALNERDYLATAKYYEKVWQTPSIKEDVNDKGKAALEHIIYYVVLAPHSNEQSDMLHHLYNNPALLKLEMQYNLAKCFVTPELMRWPGIESLYGTFLRQTTVFSNQQRWEDLHMRVIEHNIRVVAMYYTRITLERLTSLLDLSPEETEKTLCRLVVGGTVWARVDRPAGIVNFRAKRTAEEVMNDWSSDMQKLLGLVEKTWMGMNAAQAAQARVKATSSSA